MGGVCMSNCGGLRLLEENGEMLAGWQVGRNLYVAISPEGVKANNTKLLALTVWMY